MRDHYCCWNYSLSLCFDFVPSVQSLRPMPDSLSADVSCMRNRDTRSYKIIISYVIAASNEFISSSLTGHGFFRNGIRPNVFCIAYNNSLSASTQKRCPITLMGFRRQSMLFGKYKVSEKTNLGRERLWLKGPYINTWLRLRPITTKMRSVRQGIITPSVVLSNAFALQDHSYSFPFWDCSDQSVRRRSDEVINTCVSG